MKPTVSITLCCYNSERYLAETIRSVAAQTYRDWELVIINDGSKDSTDAIVQQFIRDGLPIVYHNQKNAGLAAARNKALELSRGDFIALIDHDDLWHPRKLELQMPLFADPKVAVVYAGAEVINGQGEFVREYIARSEMARGDVLDRLFLGQFSPCSSLVFRRSAIDDVGFFQPQYKITEEYDLLLRMSERYQFDYIDQALMKWRVHATNATWDFQRARRETAEVLRAVLQRKPEVAARLGPRIVSLRMAGFSCTTDQTTWLSGRGEMFRAVTSRRRGLAVVAKYLLSLLPVAFIDATQRLMSWSRRRAVAQ